jgi:hypothetical protein
MPPELALALKEEKLGDFKADSSYDMWGLGMTLWVSALSNTSPLLNAFRSSFV